MSPGSGHRAEAPDGPAIAAGATAADVMLRSPKTLGATATVEEVRSFLSNEHVAIALLTDGHTFRAAITEPPIDAPAGAAAITFAHASPPTISRGESAAAAFELAAASEHGRLIVLDTDGSTLLGLVCVSSDRRRLCKYAGPQR